MESSGWESSQRGQAHDTTGKPGHMRRSSTVRFDNPAGPAHQTTDHAPKSSTSGKRIGSDLSRASSHVEPQWAQQAVLSFGKVLLNVTQNINAESDEMAVESEAIPAFSFFVR